MPILDFRQFAPHPIFGQFDKNPYLRDTFKETRNEQVTRLYVYKEIPFPYGTVHCGVLHIVSSALFAVFINLLVYFKRELQTYRYIYNVCLFCAVPAIKQGVAYGPEPPVWSRHTGADLFFSCRSPDSIGYLHSNNHAGKTGQHHAVATVSKSTVLHISDTAYSIFDSLPVRLRTRT